MAGILNKTARQFNLKCCDPKTKHRVTVRLAPGFNAVEDKHWHSFVSKDGKTVNPYVASLASKNMIEFGTEMNDLELERDPDTKSKSKSVPMPKTKAKKESE